MDVSSTPNGLAYITQGGVIFTYHHQLKQKEVIPSPFFYMSVVTMYSESAQTSLFIYLFIFSGNLNGDSFLFFMKPHNFMMFPLNYVQV